MGAFFSFDLFFFYIFHELALIPTFLLIGIWGHGENRVAAAWKITIYLAVGSFILLLALIGSLPERAADVPHVRHHAASASRHAWATNSILRCSNLGFPADAPWIRHPDLAVSLSYLGTRGLRGSPYPGGDAAFGRAQKFGLYGLSALAVPLLPLGMQHWMNVFLVLLVGNILYVGYVTIAQKRLDMMLGYSSVMHMGYIFLGISSLNVIGLTGAAMMMFAHGLSIAVLFAVAGEIRARTGTMRLDELGGLARTAPFLALAFGMAMFASIGLPGFANFASEVMVFFGAFGYEAFGPRHGVVASFQRSSDRDDLRVVGRGDFRGVHAARLPPGVPGYDADTTAPGDPAPSYLLSVTDPASSATRWALILLVVGLIVVGVPPEHDRQSG